MLFKMTLINAIKKKFSGNIAKLLVLWVQPIPFAVATLIRNAVSKLMPNKQAIYRIIAKYDKLFLSEVDVACLSLYKTSLLSLIGKALSG